MATVQVASVNDDISTPSDSLPAVRVRKESGKDPARRTGEVVQILSQDDFFGKDWKEGLSLSQALNEESDTEQEEDGQDDFATHSVHAEGVPKSEIRLKAKDYKKIEFAETLLRLLRDELAIEGWETLPGALPATALSIHKVSGSLTNAVFFISCPSPPETQPHTGWTPAPTVLLRVYGPSSGNLISRKHELHLLHTLSADYGIGPLVLGTFANGRVEEYFDSRALNKEEMREPRINRWIARRMRELHSVDVTRMMLPEDEQQQQRSRSQTPASGAERSASGERRPTLQTIHWANGSTSSLLSNSSQSSAFSWSSAYSSDSDISSTFGVNKPLESSASSLDPPPLLASCGTSESLAIRKKRSRGRLNSSLGVKRREKIKTGAWDNIRRWNRQAEKVLLEIASLAELPGVSLDSRPATPRSPQHDPSLDGLQSVLPLDSPQDLLKFRQLFDMPRFQSEVKMYRSWVKEQEIKAGKSKRVFAHNDTQYGNLLIRRADEVPLHERPHEHIIVIDFEYASTNPRGYDIANHFHEWCADYHHESRSHSLSGHGQYPSWAERRRFFRAYIGSDLGYDGKAEQDPRTPLLSPFAVPTLTEEDIIHLSLDDQRELEDERGSQSHHTPAASAREDARVLKLEHEVRIWSPCSHALWAVWGIVQAHDDIQSRIDLWKRQAAICRREGASAISNGDDDLTQAPEFAYSTQAPEIEFDYLSYSLERVTLFRREIERLAVLDGPQTPRIE